MISKKVIRFVKGHYGKMKLTEIAKELKMPYPNLYYYVKQLKADKELPEETFVPTPREIRVIAKASQDFNRSAMCRKLHISLQRLKNLLIWMKTKGVMVEPKKANKSKRPYRKGKPNKAIPTPKTTFKAFSLEEDQYILKNCLSKDVKEIAHDLHRKTWSVGGRTLVLLKKNPEFEGVVKHTVEILEHPPEVPSVKEEPAPNIF